MIQHVLLGVENISQLSWGAINGCEAASLLEGFHFNREAVEVSYGKFLLDMPISQDGNPYHGFGGSPFKNQSGKFEAIFTRPLIEWGRKYGKLRDLSGADSSWLFDEVQKGHPVLTYVTVHFEQPKWEKYPFGLVPVNNHAVILDGFDQNRVHVSDPIDGKYWMAKEKFETIYYSRKMAVSLTK
ncbi:C39 family peptidase [Lentilactobacillus hilgardii]|uniref:C39 family peptidase n=1 Tax=Lentilactobacillus hilgardii TaxID=1588 RepID=UPI003FA5F80E